jgi:hypothetical protein
MAETLFDYPIAHRNDPMTSYDAGQKMIDSGKLNKQQADVYLLIKWYCNFNGKTDFTAKEVAMYVQNKFPTTYKHITYIVIQRRKHEIPYIEETKEVRDGCCVWRLK